MMVDTPLDNYRALVYQQAHRMRAGKPACVELDDLVQAGMIGLIEARERFDPAHGATFVGYACTRIQGAMIDELRGNDWMTRRERRRQKDVDQAICRLQHRLFRAPRDAEIADELGVSPAAYAQIVATDADPTLFSPQDEPSDDASPEDLEHAVFSGQDMDPADVSADPSSMLQRRQMYEALNSAIDLLPERQRMVMNMYYQQDLNLKQIGAHFGVTESRASQLMSNAIARLRAMLADWRNEPLHGASMA